MTELMEVLHRKANWEEELNEFLVECMRLSKKGQLKFDWQNANCGWFVATAVERMTGYDLYEPFTDVDSNLAAAKKLLDLGFGSLEQYCDAVAENVQLTEAQRGDVGLADGISDQGYVLSLLDPPFFWVIGPEGLLKYPLYPSDQSQNAGIVKCYRIGTI